MTIPAGVTFTAPMQPGFERVLTADALTFIANLHRKFDPRRHELLAARIARQARWDAGALPDFLPETKVVRDGTWRVGAIPADLLDRRVEITGPTDRKMIINALNSGAKVFMADCEDATSPSTMTCFSGRCQPRGRTKSTAVFSLRA